MLNDNLNFHFFKENLSKNDFLDTIIAKFWSDEKIPFVSKNTGGSTFDCRALQNFELENLIAVVYKRGFFGFRN